MTPATETMTQTCMVCGKTLAHESRWGPDWLVSRYCSQICSERRLAPLDYKLEEAIVQLLGTRTGRQTLTLAEVASFVDPLGWESLLERARNAARRLAAKGVLTIEGPELEELVFSNGDELRLRLPN